MTQFNKPGLAPVGLEQSGAEEQAGTLPGTEQEGVSSALLGKRGEMRSNKTRKDLSKYKDTGQRHAKPASVFCH